MVATFRFANNSLTLGLHAAGQKWGRTANFRYDCCFIWVDASLTVLDKYVDQRVDSMMNAGLLAEVHDIYNPNATYTRGLRQAIGVREFEEFLRCYYSNAKVLPPDNSEDGSGFSGELWIPLTDLREILESSDNNLKILLNEAIAKLKSNTRRLVRRQKRRLNRLKTYFEWNLHYVDATEALLVMGSDTLSNTDSRRLDPRDLWTQYVCEACGNRVLRGAHEWEQHKQGRGHRKRVLHLKKKSQSSLMDQRGAIRKQEETYLQPRCTGGTRGVGLAAWPWPALGSPKQTNYGRESVCGCNCSRTSVALDPLFFSQKLCRLQWQPTDGGRRTRIYFSALLSLLEFPTNPKNLKRKERRGHKP
ncbi:hypothetical protein ACLOJK_031249 [Asimina triloba]